MGYNNESLIKSLVQLSYKIHKVAAGFRIEGSGGSSAHTIAGL